MTGPVFNLHIPFSRPYCACYLYTSIKHLLLTLCLLLNQPLIAATQYCDNTIAPTRAGAGLGRLDQVELDTATGANVEFTSKRAYLDWRIYEVPSLSYALGANLDYTIMDFNGITPMTNGHLHNWRVPVSGNVINAGSEVHYTVTPAISVSSNALRNTDLLDKEALQLNLGLIYKKRGQQTLTWIIGALADHRFGDYGLYPVAGICWRPAQDWAVQLAMPDISVRKIMSGGISLKFYLAPEGNQWHVFSKDEQRNSDLSYKAIVSSISAQWSITPAAVLNLEFVKHTRREFSLVLDDNSLLNAGAASSTGVMLGAEVLF